MAAESKALLTTAHHELMEELLALETPEDRLSWLMERTPLHAPLPPDERDPSRKVPGCLSGLWLKGEVREGLCYFSAFSESDLVHGVTSFVCDLYSARTPTVIIAVGDSLIQEVKLDGLLSTTRKRALSSTAAFIAASATTCLATQATSLSSAA